MDISLTLGLIFLSLVVLLPFILSVIAGYEAPVSFADSLRRSARGAAMGLVMMAAQNLGRAGFKFDQWYWETLLVLPAAIAVLLVIDWLMMRQNAKRATV